jgi:excisionase family DNA binding protein
MRQEFYTQESIDAAIDRLLNKRGIATKLGISERTVAEWMKHKRLPYIKIGKSVRFHWPDVLKRLRSLQVN